MRLKAYFTELVIILLAFVIGVFLMVQLIFKTNTLSVDSEELCMAMNKSQIFAEHLSMANSTEEYRRYIMTQRAQYKEEELYYTLFYNKVWQPTGLKDEGVYQIHIFLNEEQFGLGELLNVNLQVYRSDDLETPIHVLEFCEYY